MKITNIEGKKENFDKGKLISSINKAIEAAGFELSETDDAIVLEIVNKIYNYYKVNKITPNIDMLEKDVESNLLAVHGWGDIAKEYILMREQAKKVRNAENTLLDYKKLTNNYLGVNDWRVKENSTVSYSLGGLILSNSGAVTANYWLSEIYDKEIADAHRNADMHIHDLSMLSGYCAGWSLKQLLLEGLGGVTGKITSTPASHLSTLCNQMVNFLGIMQNEWAGAQAFSSFDTYLAPFVKIDNLSYKEVKQCIQSFVFGVNTPSRWGCVPIDTEVLSQNGWKSYTELTEDDYIYTWNMNTKMLELNKVNKVITKPFSGQLHRYTNKFGYEQTVTPNHRMLVYKRNSDEAIIKKSEEIFDVKTPYGLPTIFAGSTVPDADISDNEIKLAAMIYADGSFEFRPTGDIHRVKWFKSIHRPGAEEFETICNELGLEYKKGERASFGKLDNSHAVVCYTFYGDSARKITELCGTKTIISPIFFNLSARQAKMFLETWASCDGDINKLKIQCDNQDIVDAIQHIALTAGYTSYISHRRNTTYVKLRQYKYVIPTRDTEDYDGLVWCPNVDNGTAVFRRNGNVFISGQTQAPFTNITLDWTVPDDMAYQNCIVGGKEMDFVYADCKKEMDMVNKAFIEIMIEGDANGRGFQYPIPTYSITKDFDWSETENNKLLFEMTSKYGTPYFSNYINSDMQPSDVRSMCPLTPDTKVVVKSEQNGIRVVPIREVYQTWKNHGTQYRVWTGKDWCLGHPVKVDKTEVYEITFSNGAKAKLGKNHLQPTKDFGTLHADELNEGMWIPFNKNYYETSNIGSYDLGYAVGAYAGDGSHDNGCIIYSLDAKEKDDETEKRLVQFWNGLGFVTKVNINNKVRFVRVNGNPYQIISEYVFGESALEKGFTNKVFASSIEFKNGLLDGFSATDGSRTRKRISTSSKTMREHLEILLSSMGRKCTNTIKDERDNRYGLNINYTVAFPERESYGDYYTEDDNYNYYQITKIEKINSLCDYLYCFEIDNEDHLFALANGLITHNCRLRLDLRELRKKSGGFFGSGESTGSVGVVTLNLPRLAYLAEDEKDFYKRLDKLMDIAARSIHIKRKVISQYLENGLYPYTKKYLGSFDNHFSTIATVGGNEMCLNAKWIKEDLTHEKAQQFMKDVLNHMRNRLSDYQEQYPNELFNLEAAPAESTAYRLAKHDKERYPDIITANEKCGTPYYTNSSHLPVDFSDDVFAALDIQDELQTLYTSGTVFHAFLGEKLPSWKAAMLLVRKIAENYRLPYYTMSPTYSVCKTHGYINGEKYTCPTCGEETEVYSRITGYYRPIQNWNDGKKQEFEDRKEYKIS